ncbi:MAG: SPFH domain-containing protein [Bacilli bacterium]
MKTIKEFNNKSIKLSIVITIIIFIGLILASGIYTTLATENAVIINRVTGNVSLDTSAGVGYALPIFEKVVVSPKTSIIFNSVHDGNTKDNIQVTFKITIEYKLTNQAALYKKLGQIDTNKNNEVTLKYIDTYLSNSIDTVTNKNTYDSIKSNISDMSKEVTTILKDTLPKDSGIEIIKAVVDSVNAPESVEKAIENKLAKQQEMEASEFEVEKAKNEAEAQQIKQNSVSERQQQLEACIKAINKDTGNSPACYFGNGTYVNGNSSIAVK